MLATASIPIESHSPPRTPLGPSDNTPLSIGPTHWPMPKSAVSKAMAAVQACALNARRANDVMPAATVRKEPPNRMAEYKRRPFPSMTAAPQPRP